MAIEKLTYLGEMYYLSTVGITDHDAYYFANSSVKMSDFTKIGIFSDDSSLKVMKDSEIRTSDGKSMALGYKADISLPIVAVDPTTLGNFETKIDTTDVCLLVKYTNKQGAILIRPSNWKVDEEYAFGKNGSSKFTLVGSINGDSKTELRKTVTITPEGD